MASGIYVNESVWSHPPLAGYSKMQNRRVVDVRWKKQGPDRAIRVSVAITKFPLGRDIWKKKKIEEQQKGEMQFFENNFSLDFF